MQNKKLEWADIAYFSKGLISASNNEATHISLTQKLDPVEFMQEILKAASKAELTLNILIPVEGRSENFPTPTEALPILDNLSGVYTKAITYVFNSEIKLSKAEVEG